MSGNSILEAYVPDDEAECEDCGDFVLESELASCPGCGMTVCEDCLNDHDDDHNNDDEDEEDTDTDN